MGPPKYEDAKFTITSDSKISIKMNASHLTNKKPIRMNEWVSLL
jgi:hypothetical protein